jgi:hypothetical protein
MNVRTSFRKLLDDLDNYVNPGSHRTFQDEDDDAQYHKPDWQYLGLTSEQGVCPGVHMIFVY